MFVFLWIQWLINMQRNWHLNEINSEYDTFIDILLFQHFLKKSFKWWRDIYHQLNLFDYYTFPFFCFFNSFSFQNCNPSLSFSFSFSAWIRVWSWRWRRYTSISLFVFFPFSLIFRWPRSFSWYLRFLRCTSDVSLHDAGF